MLVGLPCSRVCPTSTGLQVALTDLDKLLKEAGTERRDVKVGGGQVGRGLRAGVRGIRGIIKMHYIHA